MRRLFLFTKIKDMNLITQKSLGYILEIVKYLYFKMELEQEIEIKRLASDQTRDMFLAALDFIIDRNLTHLGAFQVRFMDEKYWSPRASRVLLLGCEKALANKFEDPLTLTPNYLLRPDIKIKTR